jgi:hypothetical protein
MVVFCRAQRLFDECPQFFCGCDFQEFGEIGPQAGWGSFRGLSWAVNNIQTNARVGALEGKNGKQKLRTAFRVKV